MIAGTAVTCGVKSGALVGFLGLLANVIGSKIPICGPCPFTKVLGDAKALGSNFFSCRGLLLKLRRGCVCKLMARCAACFSSPIKCANSYFVSL